MIAGLSLSDDFVVADIGAGTGYFTFPVTQRLPQGKVFAVDIQPEMLARIARRKTLERAESYLPQQHVLIFQKPTAQP